MWFLPSYKRPDRTQLTVNSMCDHGMAEAGVIIVNHDDPSDYESLSLPGNWSIHRLDGDNPRFADCLRWGFAAYPDAPWYGIITDDMLVRTAGFEAALIEACGAKKIASCNDLWTADSGRPANTRRMTGAIVLGGDLVRTVGGMTVGRMKHCFIDDLWEGVGRDFSCWTILDTVVEHVHFGNGKAEVDETYQRANHDIEWDRGHFAEWVNTGKPAVYEKIGTLFGQQVRTVNLTGLKVAIATPAYNGDIKVAFARSLTDTLATLSAHGVGTSWITVAQESLIQRARNRIVCEFMRGDGTHLMFIDADEAWRPDAVIRLLASGVDLCGVAAPRKQFPSTFCVNFTSDQIPVDPETGMIAVNELGTGFMMISRKLLAHMIEAMPELAYEEGEDTIHALFDFKLEDRRYWSEDYVFCQRARALGYTVWVEPRISLDHIGSHTFSGALHDWLVAQQKEATENRDEALRLEELKKVADVALAIQDQLQAAE